MGERADQEMTPNADVPGTNVSSTDVDETVDADEKAEAIRADIEQTRAEMSETIDAIQEKLSPEHIKEQVREATVGKVQQVAQAAGDKAKVAGSTLREKAAPLIAWVKRYPLPVALLVAAILGWLLRRKLRGSADDEIEECCVEVS